MTKTYALAVALAFAAQTAFGAAPTPAGAKTTIGAGSAKTTAVKTTTAAKTDAPRVTPGDYLKSHRDMDVAYDAKDKRFYSISYAKAHGMHDKGGDPLTVRRLSSLPKDAAMSRAMHGRM